MTLTRRQPDRPIPVRDVFDWMFRDPWTGMFGDGDRFSSGSMPLDLSETDDAYVVEAELPGLKPEETEVTLDGRTLTIQGRFTETREEGGKGERYLLKERRGGSLVRSISLPSTVDADKVSCEMDKGELRVTLPKAMESRAHRIPIAASSGAKRVGSSG